MQLANVNGVPVFIVNQSSGVKPDKRLLYINMRKDLSIKLIVLGSLQIIFGILCIILQSVGLGIWVINNYRLNTLSFVGHGYWNGILFFIAGTIGVVGGRQRSRCHVIAFNVFSILSASFTSVLFGITTSAAAIGYSVIFAVTNAEAQKTIAIMEISMAFTAVAEAIVAIWSSVVCCTIGACCCNSCCCCPSTPASTQVMMTEQQLIGLQQYPFAPNKSQAVMTNNQQPMFYQAHGQYSALHSHNQPFTGIQYQGLYTPISAFEGNDSSGRERENSGYLSIYEEIEPSKPCLQIIT